MCAAYALWARRLVSSKLYGADALRTVAGEGCESVAMDGPCSLYRGNGSL